MKKPEIFKWLEDKIKECDKHPDRKTEITYHELKTLKNLLAAMRLLPVDIQLFAQKPKVDVEIKGKRKRTDDNSAEKRLARKARRKLSLEKSRIRKESQRISKVENIPPIETPTIDAGPSVKLTRFEKLVQRVNSLTDISKLRKIIYNRNYSIRKAFEKANPEAAARRAVLQFPPVYDLRIVSASTWRRLNKITDKNKLIEALRKIIIDTTRRSNKPKTTGDYSNKEQDYMREGVTALKEAIMNLRNPELESKINKALGDITLADISQLFSKVQSFWAISSGHYYAVEDFDGFMDGIYDLLNRKGVSLTKSQENKLREQLFANDPREHVKKLEPSEAELFN